jgi:predicted O-linked N-acetylglucosamine transferase (SPINDLY family)
LVTVIGLLKMQMGRPDEAVKYYRQALSIKSDNFNTFTCMLLALQYSTAFSAEDIYIAHQQFGQRVQSKQGNASVIHLNDRAVGRRLKVGYVSGDFRNHAVAFFIEPILANHDRSQFEVYCYYNLSTEDDQTKKLAILADHWLICSAMSDEQLASRIREDGIDILIDLSGHTSHNRLPMFARKPAPVQITWIGYAGTTGLAAMDYRITDAYMDPPGLTERYHSETLIRLPQTSTLYQPTSGCPKVNALPALKSEQFVFASLNNLTKVNQGVVNLWSKILTAVPRAKLMLANMSEEAIEKRVVAMFEQCGIGPERLILKPRMPLLDYLALHHQIDVALDPFPYTGGTTSVHSLWMGVPVITLAGQRTVSRVGASILSQLGVTDLIVHSEDEYLQLAIKMTQNLPALSQLRQSLRARMENPTGERVDVTHALEAAYRDVWNTWCAQ